MDRAGAAAELMRSGRVNCAQAVITAFCREFGLGEELAFRLALGLGGGVGGSGYTCGAVTGAYMVLGLLVDKTDSVQAKAEMRRLIGQFNEKFIQKNGSLLCRELLGYDVSKPEQVEIIREKNLFSTICPQLVHNSIAILEETFIPGKS
ncbi:MAG: C-GCAxxG-C-C family protein [Dehalococcoidales bacterium]|nr:C-GCAxxG-C-C family protein [Dehalococcoidales bacterium]